MIKWFLFNYVRKNIEKGLFFFLLITIVILHGILFLNLPQFKTSLYGKKLTRKNAVTSIKQKDLVPFLALSKVLKKPHSYSETYSRDVFSLQIEKVECPSCGESVSKMLDVCPYCGHIFDSDGDGLPNRWEKRYVLNPYNSEDAALDKDGDSFSNLDEYRADTDPNDPLSKPEEYNPLGKYRLIKIYRKALEMLFEGYMLLPDGSNSFVINYGGSSHFVKIGDKIRGYEIVDFKKEARNGVRMGVEVSLDVSRLILKDENAEEMILEYHKIMAEKELWVRIENMDTNKTYEFHDGDKFDSFEIKKITDTSVSVIDNEGNEYNLTYKRSHR